MSGIQPSLPRFVGKLYRTQIRFFRSVFKVSSNEQKAEKTEECKKPVKSGCKKPVKIGCKSIDGRRRPQFDSCGTLIPCPSGDINVCIIGGGMSSIYMSVLLKQFRVIRRIHLVDYSSCSTNSMAGAVMDMSHIDTSTRIKYFNKKCMQQALDKMNIIALMDEADSLTDDADPEEQFENSMEYVYQVTSELLQYNPECMVVVFVRPVTAHLPFVSEIYKCAGYWDPDRIIGSTSMDSMRMEAITANLLDLNPAFLSVPMVGGADMNTIVPLFSCARPVNRFTREQEETLLKSLRGVDKEMARIESKGPSLSIGAAAAKFILTLADGLSGYENVIACAYVRSNVMPVCQFFSTQLQFGTSGVQKNFGLPKISASEISQIEQSIPFINKYTQLALTAVRNYKSQ